MGIYRYVSELGGGNKPFVAHIKLNENTDVEKGDILYFIKETHRVTPQKGVSALIAGVCARDYKAEPDGFDPSYGCGEVEVIVSPDALYRVPAYVFTDYLGFDKNKVSTSCPVVEPELRRMEGTVGMKLVLVEKVHGSSNTNPVGTVFNVTDISGVEGYFSFGTDVPSNSCKGDKYVLIPNYGCERFLIDDDGNLVLNFENTGEIIVIDADITGYTVMIKNIGISDKN